MKSILPASLLALLCVAIGCTRPSTKNTGSENQPPSVNSTYNEADTISIIKATAYTGHVYPELFEASFFDSTKVHYLGDLFTFSTKQIGMLHVESGKLVTCDPINLGVTAPFTQKFPVGNFPVQLALEEEGNYREPAFARVLFSDKEVVRWEDAVTPGQQHYALTDSIIHCYSVDAGMGVFIDSVAAAVFNQLSSANPTKQWDKAFMGDWQWGRVYSFSNHNLACFTSGAGDGCYGTYIGFDAEGKPCRLLTDFGLQRW